ncbi:Scr1 family TA system antitoxin-like transcriptional regulator [Kitasatospora sp. NBC_00315]|uniref:helix-turn-helix domain-containing protein n=1 Tax=Kitasatospora sp. NBC_00315 TaxID=2975963 RepID=UPI003244AADE
MPRRRPESGSTVSSAVLFGGELQHARESAGYSQAELAKLLHCDRTLVTRVESGQRVPQEHFARSCDQVLRMDGSLLRMWSRVDWYAGDVEHPDWFKRFADLEAEATAIRTFQASRIYGLLQTEEYARALFSREAWSENAFSIEERVNARMSRQHRFMTDDAPLLVVVLDESAIRRTVGGPVVMRGQLARLLAVAQRPNVILQVAAFHLENLTLPDISMTLLTMVDGHELVYSESLDRGHFGEEPKLIARHRRDYDVLRADALSTSESAALIIDEMERYDDHDQRGLRSSGVAQEQLQRLQRRRVHRGGPRVPRPRPRA